MASNLKITINAKEVEKFLKETPEKIPAVLQNVIHKASLLVEREAKQRSPVDTGRMRSSIATDLKPMVATIEPHVSYAIYVHEGTRFIKPRPFMKDAEEAVGGQIQSLVENELKKLQ